MAVQQSDEAREDIGAGNFLGSLFVAFENATCQNLASVGENLPVVVLDKVGQGWKKLLEVRESFFFFFFQVPTHLGQSRSDAAQ
jgi:hypothetical protein